MREEPSNLFSDRLRKTAAFSPMNSEGRQGFRKKIQKQLRKMKTKSPLNIRKAVKQSGKRGAADAERIH